MTRSKSRILLWSERFFLVAGIALLCVWGGSVIIPAIWQAWENRTFDLARRNPEIARREVPSREVPRPAHGTVVGRLSIPRLSLTSMVREGDDDARHHDHQRQHDRRPGPPPSTAQRGH